MPDRAERIIAIIGGGPAGLMAAETVARAGFKATVFDAMPSVGRKFLLAGKGGLNLTHAEPFEVFVTRFGGRQQLEPLLRDFGPDALRAWAHELGIETFVGSSNRVFPLEMKAAPLLRAWIRRLKELGVEFKPRHRWLDTTQDGTLSFSTPSGSHHITPLATIFALGGASWPQLGSNGAWMPWFERQKIATAPLEASNVGFGRRWSEIFLKRFAGAPIKTIAARVPGSNHQTPQKGELMITERGLEGGLIYALSADLRAQLRREGYAELMVDLVPDRSLERLEADLLSTQGKSSLSTHLKKKAGLSDAKIGLLRECAPSIDLPQLPHSIKSLSIRLEHPFPIEEAISTAGGVCFENLDDNLMINDHPGLFIAGEMLDFDAPTGGYLLSAAFATGRRAGEGATRWLVSQ